MSTHGTPYVYATTNLELALLFGSKNSHGDFDGKYGMKGDKPFFYEAYKDAFKERFQGQTCYVYEVKPDTFLLGQTNFRGETVSPEPVEVVGVTEIPDLYSYLNSLIEQGKIIFQEYIMDEGYQNMIDEHIKNCINNNHILDDNSDSVRYQFCMSKFPKLMEDMQFEKATNISID